MESSSPRTCVSNLTPIWDEEIPAELMAEVPTHPADSPVDRPFAATIIQRAVHADIEGHHVSLVSPPMEFEPRSATPVIEAVAEATVAEQPIPRDEIALPFPQVPVREVERDAAPDPVPAPRVRPEPANRSAYDLLSDRVPVGVELAEEFDVAEYDLLRRRDIAREVLRSRLIALAEQREARSAYEIVFLMLAFAVMVLLTAPPLVQILLAANGVQS